MSGCFVAYYLQEIFSMYRVFLLFSALNVIKTYVNSCWQGKKQFPLLVLSFPQLKKVRPQMLFGRPTPRRCVPTSKITAPTPITGRPTSKSRHPTPSELSPTLHLSRPTCVGRAFCSVGAIKVVVFLSFCYFYLCFPAKETRQQMCCLVLFNNYT